MQKITIKCKLNPTKEQIKILDNTLSKCLEALNYISKIAWDNKCFNRVALHHLTYYKVKSKYKLVSQICCAIKDKVAFSYKTDRKKQHIFKNPVLPLNFARTISIKGEISSISTISGRQKIPLKLGEYQKQALSKAIRFCGSELIKQKDNFYLNITIEILDKPIKETKNVIGVDIGITNLATCSTGDNFAGEQVQFIRNRYQTLRSKLQSKGTKSAKRHLKKLSGREKRFQKDQNHQISKKIVELANRSNSAIALEDLTNIRKTARQRKAQRGIFNKWAFNQLQNFIEYKAQIEGIPIVYVDPKYTSQTCSFCGYISKSSRKSQSLFSCSNCGISLNADFNGAINIAQRGVVNLPIVAPDFQGSYKPSNKLLGS